MIADTVDSTVSLLSRAIMDTLHAQRQEEYSPSGGPDFMDSKIADAKHRVSLLRKMREDYEDEMSKPLGSYC